MQDMHSNINFAQLIGAATLSADNTPASVDLQGYDSAEIALAIGVGGITFTSTNKIEFKLTHSDDGTTFTPVTTDHMIGVTVPSDGIIKALVAAHAAAGVYRYGYVGGRRFLQLLADFSGTHGAGTPIAAFVIRGNSYDRPLADQP